MSNNEMQVYDLPEVPIHTGIAAGGALQQHIAAPSAVASVEQARAVAEVQAAMVVARMNPRNELSAYNRIIQACRRKGLAEAATYAYKRGGQIVTGPSIRLAEVLARAWGNMTYGLRELNRSGAESEVEAFAWDLETNTRVTRLFRVKHVREKKEVSVELNSERDIYELIANMGQRRVRACILELLPGDIVEAAEQECRKTLEAGGGVPFEDRVRSMVVAFNDVGVTEEMIERFLQHPIKAIVPAELVRLQQVYRSIRDGVASREHFFALQPQEPAVAEPQSEVKKPRGRKSQPTPDTAPVEHGPERVKVDCPENPGETRFLDTCIGTCPREEECSSRHNDSLKI